MKTSFRTIKITLLAILITCCFALAQESSGGNSEPVFPERPVRNEMESDAAYRHRLTRWQAEIRQIAANANTEISLNNPSLPVRPEKRAGESETSFRNRTRQWEAEIRSITEAAAIAKSETSLNTPNLPARPTKRHGESDASFRERLAEWEYEVRHIIEETNPEISLSNPSQPERQEGESDASFVNRLTRWEADMRRLAAEANPDFTTSTAQVRRIDSTKLPERPNRREGESGASYNARVRQWEEQVRNITAEAARANPGTSSDNLTPPKRRDGESDASFRNRLNRWEAEVRRYIAEVTPQPATNLNLPTRPVKRDRESDDSFNNRLNLWEAEVRRIAAKASIGISTDTSAIPPRPVKRAGESDSSFRNRQTQWAAQVKLITTKQQEEDELEKLRKELDKLSKQIISPRRTDSYSSKTTERIGVIPMGEIETDNLLAINEDLKIMSQILRNELNQQSLKREWISNDSKNPDTGTVPINANILSSLYLEGYGVLFEMNVNFPLSIPYEELQGQENQKEESADSVWERTKQQILEPQSNSNPYFRSVHERPEIIDVEKIKALLIKTLKYASNIRSLKPDESVILRIVGAEQSIRVTTIREIEENKYSVTYESNGTQFTTVLSGNVYDKLKSLSAPTILIIRAKKSDIDAFAKDELDFEKFREKVQVFSYPLISEK